MKKVKKCSVLLLLVGSLWLLVLSFDHMEEDKKQATKPTAIDPVYTTEPDDVPKQSDIPQSTQVPSAKGVTVKKIYRLAQLMYAENGSAEDDDCVLLTGIVAVKRMRSKKYPNTLEGVISQEGQYSTYQTGRIECEPDERCLEIAEEILRFDLQKYYPDNLVFQAEFPQGSEIYEQFGHEYFCLD